MGANMTTSSLNRVARTFIPTLKHKRILDIRAYKNSTPIVICLRKEVRRTPYQKQTKKETVLFLPAE
jgi:hypothetical protein